MDEGIGPKGVTAQETSRRRHHRHLNGHTGHISTNGWATSGPFDLCGVSRLDSHISDKIRQRLKVFSNRLLSGAAIVAVAAIALVGLTERAGAAYVNLDFDGLPYFGHDNVSPIACTSVGPVPQFFLRRNVFQGDCLIPGEPIDKGRYYWLDEGRYYWLEKGQYNLLGGMSYLLGNFHYVTFDSAGMFGILYGPILPVIGLNPFVDTISSSAAGVGVDSYRGWSYYSNAGDYIDIGQYYLLDKAQYYYLDKWQYKLLGGANYILGHPCYPLWYHYDSCLRVKDYQRETGRRDGLDADQVNSSRKVTIFDEPAQPTDELLTFTTQDEGTRWYPTEVLPGVSCWTSRSARVNINAIPEPSTIGFLGLGALVVLFLGNKRRVKEKS